MGRRICRDLCWPWCGTDSGVAWQVSLSVLAAGDETSLDEPAELNMDEDIEENMLRPLGIEPEPIDLMIRVYVGPSAHI